MSQPALPPSTTSKANPSDYVRFESKLAGFYDDYFQRRDTIKIKELVWSSCGKARALNIEADVNLSANTPDSSGAFYVDSLDGSFTHVYGIRWRRCS